MSTSPYLRPLDGRPGLLALGSMNFGTRTPEPESLRILDRALEAGVVLFDTANMYGNGVSERIVGKSLRGRRDQVLLATKVGLGRVERRAEGLGPETVLAACDASLDRLGTDHIDLYYLHAPDPETPPERTLEAIATLLEAGKIRHWGVSNYASWQILELRHLAEAAGMPMPVVAQQIYNPLIRQLDLEYFRFAARYPIHTTIYNPLAGGLLTGRHRIDEAPPKGSRFDVARHYRRRYWNRAVFEAVEQLQAIATAEGVDLVTLAYAFAIGHPGVDSVLVGPGTLPHLDAALSARDTQLSPEARERILTVGENLVGTNATYAR